MAALSWNGIGSAQSTTQGYIGADQCGTCHAAKLAIQKQSDHAHSLARPADHALAGQFAPDRKFIRADKYQFQFSFNGNQLHLQAWDDSQEINLPVEWAFGAGTQAVTFTSRVNSDWYLEHFLSYYSAARSYAATPGQTVLNEDTLSAALGKVFRSSATSAGVYQCFQCHSTGPVGRGPDGDLRPSELGVRCEVCHGPGKSHRDAVLGGDIVRARASIQKPQRMSAPELNQFCGQCHRQPAAAGVEIDWNVPWNVRHQPVYLSQAACFLQSKGALSCLTCHDPHAQLVRDDTFYNSKCARCHNQKERPPSPVCLNREQSNCVNCHMPRVSPQSYLRFTNHWIGIYEGGDGLRPISRSQPIR